MGICEQKANLNGKIYCIISERDVVNIRAISDELLETDTHTVTTKSWSSVGVQEQK
jgi:hypothetical protein